MAISIGLIDSLAGADDLDNVLAHFTRDELAQVVKQMALQRRQEMEMVRQKASEITETNMAPEIMETNDMANIPFGLTQEEEKARLNPDRGLADVPFGLSPSEEQTYISQPNSTEVPEITETNLAPEITATNLAPEITETNMAQEITETNLAPEITETNLAPDIMGTNMTPEITETNLAPEITETNLAPEITETNLAPEITATNMVPDITETNLAPDITETNDIANIPFGLTQEEEQARLNPDRGLADVPFGLSPSEEQTYISNPSTILTTLQENQIKIDDALRNLGYNENDIEQFMGVVNPDTTETQIIEEPNQQLRTR